VDLRLRAAPAAVGREEAAVLDFVFVLVFVFVLDVVFVSI
jgi:hypothetical protein